MKKTRLMWSIVITAILCVCACVGILAGCGTTKIEAVKITNKEALAAEWTVGGTIRKIELSFEPESFNAKNIEYTVTSSDESVVSADGLELKAVAAGTATITVTAEGKSDSVDITVKQLRPNLESITIANKEALAADWVLGSPNRTIELTFAPAEYYSVDNTNVEIELSNPTVKAKEFTLQAIGVGKTTLTVSVGDVKDTVEIATSVTAPEITANNVSIFTDEETKITADALTCDGKKAKVTILDAPTGLTVDSENATVTADKKGEYTLTLHATDERDPSKYTDKTITVHAYRKVIDAVAGSNKSIELDYSDAYTSDSEQTVKVNSSAWVMGRFAATPSTVYYASVTYTGSGVDGRVLYGMSHSQSGNTDKWLVSYIDAGSRDTQKNFKAKEFDMTESSWSNHQEGEGNNVSYMYRLENYQGITIENCFPITFETIRKDNFFYFFVNGKYVYSQSSEYFTDVPTVPGFVTHDAPTLGVALKNVVWTTDRTEVETKLATLTQNGLMGYYLANSAEGWASGSKDPTNFTNGTTTPEKGWNFTFNKTDKNFNGSMISPHVYFSGDFEVEWDYVYDQGAGDSGEEKYMFEIRDQNFKENTIACGIHPGKQTVFVKNSNGTREYATEMANWKSWVTKFHFKVGRVCNADGTMTYTYTITATGGDKTETFTKQYTNTEVSDYTKTVQFVWHNAFMSGEYSNIRWSVPVKVDAVSIDNKTELTAAWNLGEGERELGYTITPVKEGLDISNVPVQITSNNESVVKVVDGKLQAVGIGKATITVTAGGKSDSVEIDVTLPSVTGIEITNKTALTADWYVGGEAREVEVSFTPSVLDGYNVDYTIESDNESVVKVVNGKLTAVGTGTAIITVTSGDYTDTVTINIEKTRPDLNSITVTNKTNLEEDWTLGVDGTRTIAIAFDPAGSYTTENTNVTVSITGDAVTANGLTLTASKFGTATVTVSFGTVTDSFTVNVVVANPTINTLDGAQWNAFTGDTFSLTDNLEVEALGCDNSNAVTLDVTTTGAGLTYNATSKIFTASETGEFTITLRATDTRDTSKTTERTITVNVYRKLIDAVAGSKSDISLDYSQAYTANETQTVAVKTGSWVMGRFAATPSTAYYASVTYTGEGMEGGTLYGISHSIRGDNDKWLVSYIDAGRREDQKNFKAKEFDMTDSSWDKHDNGAQYNVSWMYRLENYQGITIENCFPITFETIRKDNFFYFFVNGKYVYSQSSEYFTDVPTVPGFVTHDAPTLGVALKNVVWTTDRTEVETKLATLTQNGLMGYYLANSAEGWASGSKDPTNFTNGTTTPEKGWNFTFNKTDKNFNGSMISPHVYFSGDFEVEWDYVYDQGAGDSGEEKYMFEIRDQNFKENTIACGIHPGKQTVFVKNSNGTREYATEMANWKSWVTKFHFKVGRVCNADGTMTYTYTITATGGDKTETFTKQYTNTEVSDYTKTVQFVWHNAFMSGEYSNIRWSVPVKVDAVSIDNKTELTAAWNLGEGERELGYTITPVKEGLDISNVPVQITSNNESVVKVVDGKLQAVGIGKATITVTAGGKSDSVEIDVTLPSVTGIEITNKTALTADWYVGGEAREVEVSFTPSVLDGYNVDYTIESDNESVVKVVNGKLTAVGTGTAIITVTSGDYTDTVTINIEKTRPDLNSITVTNKTNLEEDWTLGVDGTRTIA